MKTLFPPQADHIKVLAEAIKSNSAALDTSKTGTGKTICSTELSKLLGMSIMVVCPKPAIPNWEREIAGQKATRTGVINYEKLRTGKTEFGVWKGGQFVWTLPPKTLLVFDEVHACKGTYTKNAKMLIGAKGRPVAMLSATAAEDPTEMRAIGYLLNLHRLNDFFGWCLRNGCKQNFWGALEFPKEGAEKNLTVLNRMIYPMKGSQLSRAEMSKFFTKSHIIYDPVEFAAMKDITRAYTEAKDQFDALFATIKEESVELEGSPAEALVALTRARQKVELLKLPEMADFIETRLAEGLSIPVFLNFNDSIRALSSMLDTRGMRHGIIWGEDTKNRDKTVEDFQCDRVHILLCNIAAGGTAINLHHTATSTRPRLSVISPTFNAKTMEQVFGRVDRAGALSESTQYVMMAAGSVEEKVMEAVKIKIDNMRRLHEKLVYTTPPTPTLPDVKTDKKATKPANETAAPAATVKVACTDEVVERAHAEYSPSKLEDIAICPGYVGGKSHAGAMTAAESGTRCHNAVEKRDLTGLTEEEALLAEMAIGYEDEVIPKDASVEREIRVEVFEQFGYLDTLAILRDGVTAHIIDHKFGKIEVRPAHKNLQGKAYVMGVFARYPKLETITVHFCMPRLDMISIHTFTRADLPSIQREIRLILDRATSAKSLFNSDEVIPLLNPLCESCDFCGNRPRCRALAKHVITVAGKLGVKELPKNPVVTLEDVRDPQDTGVLLRMAAIVEKWAEDIKAWALQQALVDDIVPEGYTLVEANSPRKVPNPLLAYEALKERLSMEDILACTTGCSIGKLEELWAKSSPRGKKQSDKDRMTELLSEQDAISSDGKYHKLVPVKTKA